VTEVEQLDPAARLVAHALDEMEKSPAFVPVMATLLMVTAEDVVLERVAD